MQSDPQLIPVGLLVTVLLAEPRRVTVRSNLLRVNVAVTVVLAVRVTMHVPVPLHPPPLHPVKSESDAAAAVRVTDVPLE